jgi:hypothetical protein
MDHPKLLAGVIEKELFGTFRFTPLFDYLVLGKFSFLAVDIL